MDVFEGRHVGGVRGVGAQLGDGVPTAFTSGIGVCYSPILDVARGVAAGYEARPRVAGQQEWDVTAASLRDVDADGEVTGRAITLALEALPSLPVNTFLTVPVGAAVAMTIPVRRALGARRSLHGVILDVTGFDGTAPVGDLEYVLAQYRDNGALIAVGGHGASQPELSSIVRLKPSILRLGRDWVRGIEQSETKRTAIEVIGQVASQLDAWILAEGVSTTAELRALAGLSVPLAQGPLIGDSHDSWPTVQPTATAALPDHPHTGNPHTDHPHAGDSHAGDGVLRSLLQHAYTTRDAMSAAAVLPETLGFDIVVVLDEHARPTSMLEQGATTSWETTDVLAVNVDTPIADAIDRAMIRPRATRFTPLACTDAAGRFLGILRIERLVSHLAKH